MALFYLFASFITLNHLLLTVAVVAGLNLLAATQDIAVDSIIVDVLSTDDIGRISSNNNGYFVLITRRQTRLLAAN